MGDGLHFEKKTEDRKMVMRKPIWLAGLAVLAFAACSQERSLVRLRSDYFVIGLDSKGRITELTDLKKERDYLAAIVPAPVLSCRVEGEMLAPQSARFNEGILSLLYDRDLEAQIRTEQKPTHLTFELVGFNRPEEVELVAWGPIPTTINKSIGETVGVVRGEEFAIGVQTLNPKTLGG